MAEETPIEPRPGEATPVGLPEGTRLVRVVLLQDGEEPSAFLIERRLRALRQLYALLFLLRSNNTGIATITLDEDPEADLHFSGSSLGVFAADCPIMRIGIDPTGMPIGLPRIGNRVHHERVDVGSREAMFGERVPDSLLLYVQHAGWPGMRHVGQQFDALVAEAVDSGNRFFNEIT